MRRPRLVAFTGAGISAESGLRTFRDGDGLWEEYRIEDVATPEAWQRDPKLVLRFYDERRDQVLKAAPNAAHEALARLEEAFDVRIVTQNIDDLHERAGSSYVLHLHGEIRKARSTADPDLLLPVEGGILPWGATCPLGSQLRPHVVWFGEAVPLLPQAARIVGEAEVLIVVGTSLQVWPAAGLVDMAPPDCSRYLVDPKAPAWTASAIVHIKRSASEGVPWLADRLLAGEVP
ncbi:MAG: NAD-dependent deacylase [Flavobacteriales bacterium]|nr:NAD-dependent deacylase [Flavobacteriales bacterium]